MRALVDFSLEFSKYIWFPLHLSRSSSMTRSSNCGTKFIVITSQPPPPQRFHLLICLEEFSHLKKFPFDLKRDHLSSSHFVTEMNKFCQSNIHQGALIDRLTLWLCSSISVLPFGDKPHPRSYENYKFCRLWQVTHSVGYCEIFGKRQRCVRTKKKGGV